MAIQWRRIAGSGYPASPTIKLTAKTTLTFQSNATETTGTTSTELKLPEASPPPAKKSEKRRAGPKKGDTSTTVRAVAKFITDRPGETLVRLGEDGHLPELALQEVTTPKADKRKQASQGNPVLIYGVLWIQPAPSVAMMFLEPPSFEGQSTSKAGARRIIVEKFIGGETGPTKPYQRLLREAGLAHSRGDFVGERSAYLNVLSLLNSEDKNPFTGITGSADSDDELKNNLAVLLSR